MVLLTGDKLCRASDDVRRKHMCCAFEDALFCMARSTSISSFSGIAAPKIVFCSNLTYQTRTKQGRVVNFESFTVMMADISCTWAAAKLFWTPVDFFYNLESSSFGMIDLLCKRTKQAAQLLIPHNMHRCILENSRITNKGSSRKRVFFLIRFLFKAVPTMTERTCRNTHGFRARHQREGLLILASKMRSASSAGRSNGRWKIERWSTRLRRKVLTSSDENGDR